MVHHHFCILQEKCCKLEGKKLLKLFFFMHLMFYYQVIANAEFFSRNNRVIENAKQNQTRFMIMLVVNQLEFVSTVFPRIIVATTILFLRFRCDNYSRETTIQRRKLLISFFLGDVHKFNYCHTISM